MDVSELSDREYFVVQIVRTSLTLCSVVVQLARADGGSAEKVELMKSIAEAAFSYTKNNTTKVLAKEGPIEMYVVFRLRHS